MGDIIGGVVSVVGSLLGGGAAKPPAAAEAEKPPPMPDELALNRAAQLKVAKNTNQSGRASTLLSGTENNSKGGGATYG